MKMYTPHKESETMASVISFRIDDEDRDLLQQYAEEFDATLSWAARRAIKEFTTKLAKESKNEEGDCIFTESDGVVG
jgi:hypothetical protein